MKAERLNVVQQATSLQAQRKALARMLSTFCGIEVKEIKTPPLTPPLEGRGAAARPEIKAIDAQLRLADAQEKALDAALMPKLGVFAQGYYGYPGYNMFEDMMSRKFSWNGMIGARLTWNIGALYSRKTIKQRYNCSVRQLRPVATCSSSIIIWSRFSRTRTSSVTKLMADDEEIITLRSSIRKAAESKLSHGIIDVNDLVKEINNENAARVAVDARDSDAERDIRPEIYNESITI